MLLLLFKVDVHESSARVTVFPLLAFHVCFLWTMSPKLRLRSSSRVSYFRLRFKDSFSSCFYKIYVYLPIFSPSFLIIKMHHLWFFLHVSISGTENNIKIICSIRFSLFITIDRFYKLFAEGAFVNRRPEMIPPLFHNASPIQPPPLRGTSFQRKEGVSTRSPSLGRGCRAQRGGVGFLFAAKPPPLCLPHWGNAIKLRKSLAT